MAATGSSETVANFYHASWLSVPQHGNLHSYYLRTSQLKSKVRSIFRHLYIISKKRQWAPSCLSVCLSARISAAPSWRILVKF